MAATFPAPFKWVQGDRIGDDPESPYYLVYRVVSENTAKMNVVKQVKIPSKDPNEEGFAKCQCQFEAVKNEYDILSSAQHANIVECFEAEQTAEFFNLFVEYFPGGSIQRLLKRFSTFEENLTRSFTRDILNGLTYLHSLSIVHLAISSKNIFVHLDGICKIGGFTDAIKLGH
ncbi:hypothetical protein FRC04_010158 [Tulasnella sp. 424]|nr:hypothetical protein FRC04_010158 [Tulasnella sp. 424]